MQNMYILQILSLKNKIILKYSKIIVDRHPYKNGKWKIETCFEHIGRIFLEHVKTTGHVKAISAIIKKTVHI